MAELSGFDPAIVLPDAPLESTARALTWASFVGAGQTCVAVKRVYVVGDPAPWAEALAAKARALRVGDPAAGPVDVGPMISAEARDRFHATIGAAVAAGARVLAGGSPVEGPGSFYPPTVLLADTPGAESALAGCFGPVVVVRGVADAEAAVEAANAGPFGLSASVWGRDLRLARSLAVRLEAGTVAVNEAVTTSAHASAPFGGLQGQRLRPDPGRRRPPRAGPAPGDPRPESRRIPPPPLPVHAAGCSKSSRSTAGSSTRRGDAREAMMGRFRFSTRGLILAVAVVGFDLAAMTRAVQQGRAAHAVAEYAVGFGLVLLILNLVLLGLWWSFATGPTGRRGVACSTPSPVVIAGLYLAVLALAILSVLFLTRGDSEWTKGGVRCGGSGARPAA